MEAVSRLQFRKKPQSSAELRRHRAKAAGVCRAEHLWQRAAQRSARDVQSHPPETLATALHMSEKKLPELGKKHRKGAEKVISEFT